MRVWESRSSQCIRIISAPNKAPVTALIVLDRPPHLASGQGKYSKANGSDAGFSKRYCGINCLLHVQVPKLLDILKLHALSTMHAVACCALVMPVEQQQSALCRLWVSHVWLRRLDPCRMSQLRLLSFAGKCSEHSSLLASASGDPM